MNCLVFNMTYIEISRQKEVGICSSVTSDSVPASVFKLEILRHKITNIYLSMKRQPHTAQHKWILALSIACVILSLSLLFLITLTSPNAILLRPLHRYAVATSSLFVVSKVQPEPVTPPPPPPPRLAYLISGSKGHHKMLRRTLLALYHPYNQYVVHLDAESSPEERLDLFNFVKNCSTFVQFGNVRMITKANLVTYRGPTMVANTLHAAAVLLKDAGEWDWFINLSTQDDFSRDGSVSSTLHSCHSFESEMRAKRLSLLDEIGKRKIAEDALGLMYSQWQRVADLLLAQTGLTFSPDSPAELGLIMFYNNVIGTHLPSTPLTAKI